MKKYIKKPIVIEAYQTDKEIDIETLEGTMHASVGDFLITGVNGEKYPCKPDIFEKTYDEFNEDEISSNMTFNEYQDKTNETAIYDKSDPYYALIYNIIGICGEAGECSNVMQKSMRKGEKTISPELKQTMLSEISDVLWFCAQACSMLETDFSDVAKYNIEKLLDRKRRNKINGSGNNR